MLFENEKAILASHAQGYLDRESGELLCVGCRQDNWPFCEAVMALLEVDQLRDEAYAAKEEAEGAAEIWQRDADEWIAARNVWSARESTLRGERDYARAKLAEAEKALREVDRTVNLAWLDDLYRRSSEETESTGLRSRLNDDLISLEHIRDAVRQYEAFVAENRQPEYEPPACAKCEGQPFKFHSLGCPMWEKPRCALCDIGRGVRHGKDCPLEPRNEDLDAQHRS